MPQELINELLVQLGQSGRNIVRLKGGDPFVFGRGGEEALALAAAGLDFEVVPGVSSVIAAPAAAGIPVTHRGVSASFTVVTGHRQHGEHAVNWQALAQAGGTIVVLMGVAQRGIDRGGVDGRWPRRRYTRLRRSVTPRRASNTSCAARCQSSPTPWSSRRRRSSSARSPPSTSTANSSGGSRSPTRRLAGHAAPVRHRHPRGT